MTAMRTFFCGLLLLTCFTSFRGDTCSVQYNGIYTASVDEETDAHIRFYEDGVVIVSTSVKNIKDVSSWFTKENIDRILKGKYKVKGCTIKFKVKGETGEQVFNGTITGNTLQVEITQGKNSKAFTTRTYTFISL
jgi:hypothetical protein